ncbi:MAG: rhomboid family intramembrane serine protease [Planctomycetes bacterium]|nr:rhomboid family intramembrane serine protease [Planctomycetota bacterium]
MSRLFAGKLFSEGDQLKGFKTLLGLNLIMFVLTMFIFRTEWAGAYRNFFFLYVHEPKFWQAITYMFMHADFGHIFGNLIGLCFLGVYLEPVMGTRAFVRYYLICGLGAAFLGYGIGLFAVQDAPVIGASGAIMGLLYAVYCLFPDATVYIFFTIPVKIKYLVLIVGVLSFAMILESDGTAHFAHLGGLLTGLAYFRYGDELGSYFRQFRAQQVQKQIVKHEEEQTLVKEEVDRILAKISKEGMGALSQKEKNYLKKASQKYKHEGA